MVEPCLSNAVPHTSVLWLMAKPAKLKSRPLLKLLIRRRSNELTTGLGKEQPESRIYFGSRHDEKNHQVRLMEEQVMGQKVNPISMRLQVNKDWRSKWFADKRDYANYLRDDLAVRKLIRDKLGS